MKSLFTLPYTDQWPCADIEWDNTDVICFQYWNELWLSRYDIKLLLLAEQLYYAHECHICISRYLNKMVVDHHTQLDQYLQTTMLSLRTKKQLTTKYIPYFLMCGREVRYHNTLTIHSLSGCV